MTLLESPQFQMSMLLFISLAGYLISSRINQSAVVGIILAGIAMGPSLLGLITYTDFVSNLGNLGAVVLLFTVGLHFKLKDIAKKRYFLIALLGIILPWITGYYLGLLFGMRQPAAIFIGTALTATSIAITANVLKEMNKLDTTAARAIIGAAVIDDVLGLLALSMSEEMAAGFFSLSSVLFSLGKAVLFLIVAVFVGHIIANRTMKRIDRSNVAKRYPEFPFIFALMVAFLYALCAEYIGLSAIVGSFIAGVSLEGVGLVHAKDFREGVQYLEIIFGSIFFVSLGILVNFRELNSFILLFLILLTGGAVLSKLIACSISSRIVGMGIRDSIAVGFGMVPRGEVAMIVALYGLNKGIIGQDIYVSILLMSLATTIITPIIFRNWLIPETQPKKIF